MALMAKLVDTSLCQGCKACQVACKQWNQLPAVTEQEGLNRGSYANPPDHNHHTWNTVRFNEVLQTDGSVQWIFWKDSCRHCPEPFCQAFCPVRDSETGEHQAITRDAATGAVLYHSELCGDCRQECLIGCPYDVPRFLTGTNEEGSPVEYRRAFKCRLCVDRLHNENRSDGSSLGLSPADRIPACVKTCPAGAIQFGARDEMILRAKKRMVELIPRFPKTAIYPAEGYGVMWIMTEDWHDLGLPLSGRTAARGVPARENALSTGKRGFLHSLGQGALALGVAAVAGLVVGEAPRKGEPVPRKDGEE